MRIILLVIVCFLSAGASSARGEDVAPPAPAQGKTAAKETISLDLKGVDINELFKILSLKSGLTVISTPEVQGRITVFLNNLSFDDALDVILTIQGLACEKTGNIIKVMTAAEYERAFGKKFGERKKVKTIKLAYAKPSDVAKVITSLKSDMGKIIVDEGSGTIVLIDTPVFIETMEEAIKDLDQALETAVFDINYATSADIKASLNDLITPGVGQVIIDTRSNKAVVTDLPRRLEKIKRLMTELDESSRQVLISGQIVQVTLNDHSQKGIEWEKVFGSGLSNLDLVGKFSAGTLTSYGKLSVGTLSANDYNVVLTALQEYGDVSTISRPQIVAVNKEEAKILVGSREAYVTQAQSQSEGSTVTSESVQFIDVGVKLVVVPTIGKDGFITMKIKPEVSSVREVLKTTAGSQVPIVETSETETVVKVKDGAMVMIGGLLKKEKTDSTAGIPVLGKLPVVGGLFGSRDKQERKTELIIFLSPKLISGDVQNPAETEKSEKNSA